MAPATYVAEACLIWHQCRKSHLVLCRLVAHRRGDASGVRWEWLREYTLRGKGEEGWGGRIVEGRLGRRTTFEM